MSMQRVPEPELMEGAGEAEAYASADFGEVNQAFVERLVELVNTVGPADVLDLGTGPADIPIRLARARAAWRVVALDASHAMLRIARENVARAGLADRVTAVCADAKATPFPDRSFDAIFSNSILHHVSEPGLVWSEVKRLARPGCAVLMRDLARPESEEAACRIVERYAGTESLLLREEYYRSLLAAYTVEEVQVQLAGAGLGMLSVEMVTDRHLDVFGRVG